MVPSMSEVEHPVSGEQSRPLRIVLVVDWANPGRWLWDYLPATQDQVRTVWMRAPRDRFPGWGKVLGYYPAYIYHAWRAAREAAEQKPRAIRQVTGASA